MPQTLRYIDYPWTFINRGSSSRTWDQPVSYSHQVSPILVLNDDRPATVKRAKPEDLFKNGTSRMRTIVKIFDQPSTTIQNSGLYMYKNQPTSKVWGFDQKSFPNISIDREAMYNSIRNRMRGQAVNLAQNVAEYRQTADLFYFLAKTVATRGRNLSETVRKSKRRGEKAATPLAKAHLAFQYGVKPLCSDMVDSIEELIMAVNRPVYLQGLESRKQLGYVEDSVRADQTTLLVHPATSCRTRKLRYRTRWRAELNTTWVHNTLVAHGFTNPIALAYELVPYSFVIDWWINVGEVLASLDNLLLVNELLVIDSSSEVRNELLKVRTAAYPNGNFAPSVDIGKTWRQDIRSAPRAISRVNTLRYKPSISLTHIMNGLALLHLAVGRRSR